MMDLRAGTVTGGVPRATVGAGWRLVGVVAALSRSGVVGVAKRGVAGTASVHRGVLAAGASLADAVAGSALVDRVVDVQLRRVVAPLVADVLDEVLGQLEAEPDRLRVLIRGQREGIVGDVVDGLRGGAAAGDAGLKRMTRRLRPRRVPATGAGDAAEPR
jgi:hypothetical protein